MNNEPPAPRAGSLEQLLTLLAQQLADQLKPLLNHDCNCEERSPWMNVATAARYLDWPRQRLYKLTAQGAIPHYKHDGRLLFNRAELDHWLHAHAQPETPLDHTRTQSYS